MMVVVRPWKLPSATMISGRCDFFDAAPSGARP